jgi:hypothetical protein
MKYVNVLFITFSIFICCKNGNKSNFDLLTRNGKGKYWDLVYQSDVYGTTHKTLFGKDSLPESSLFFSKDKVINYFVYTKNEIVNTNNLKTDIKFNDDYQLNKDTLQFNGYKFLIKKLTEDSLFLENFNQRKMLRIYSKPKVERTILDSIPDKSILN